MTDDSTFALWKDWLETICKDVQGLLINRHIFREVREIIRTNPRIQSESSFYEWMGNVYATSAVIGVRRQVDWDSESISLLRFLREIRDRPQVLSRERYVSLYEDSGLPHDFVQKNFDQFAGALHSHVDPVPIGEDLTRLVEKANRIRKFANKRIAHFDRSEYKNLPTYAELDDCLDYLEELLKKYLAMLRAESWVHIVPTWQYDWKQVFR